MGACTSAQEKVGSQDTTVLEADWKTIHSMARWNRDFEILRRLIEKNPEIVSLRDPKTLNTPLHISSQNGHEEITEILISGKAEINAKNRCGQTPLHMCMSYDYYNVVVMLLKAGADENVTNDEGHKAITGLTGNKTVGMVALAAAHTQEDIHAALARIEVNISQTDKVEFIKTYLKVKKELGNAIWGEPEQAKFESVLKKFP